MKKQNPSRATATGFVVLGLAILERAGTERVRLDRYSLNINKTGPVQFHTVVSVYEPA
ncbi:hypothetical protein EMIT051CA3_100009 [Pseudomonas chlororaphis]